MDLLLSRVTQQAVQYAIRSGISITTGYAIKNCSRLLQQAPRGKEREELRLLQSRLESKIRVIAPSIDMIELIAARGNTSLESAVSLTKSLRYDIQQLGRRLEAAATINIDDKPSRKAASREENDRRLQVVIDEMRLLLARIEDAVPLINLAITTSGVNLSTKLSGTISPSRLLQASTFLTAADSRFSGVYPTHQQVGPTYTLTLYMLFAGHAARPVDDHGVRDTTWKEVIHKARVKLWRVPLEQLYALPGEVVEPDTRATNNTVPADSKLKEFAYQLVIVEDNDDDRFHEPEESAPFDGVQNAGIRDVVPVHEISKIFYADTGKILNIGTDGETNNPVLLLKRDVHADPPRRMLQRSQSRTSLRDEGSVDGNSEEEGMEQDDQTEIDAQLDRESAPPTPAKEHSTQPNESNSWRLPADLDPEWMALEVYTEKADSDSEDELADSPRPSTGNSEIGEKALAEALSGMKLRSTASPSPGLGNQLVPSQPSTLQLSPGKRAGPPIKTSLSLLEMLMKLAALQQFRQESHLAIEDELLNFFLEDSATAGAGADKGYRQRLRHDATRRVGFDPYDESPVKKRTEEYIRHAQNASPTASPTPEILQPGLEYDDDDDESMQRPMPRLDFARPSIEQPSSRGNVSFSPPSRYQQTPPKRSTPDTSRGSYSSAQPLTTPSNTTKTRAAALRAQSEPKAKSRSPLHEVTNDEN